MALTGALEVVAARLLRLCLSTLFPPCVSPPGLAISARKSIVLDELRPPRFISFL